MAEAVMENGKDTAALNSPNRAYTLERTRNIGIAAHIDAGKTTTTERILFYTGLIHKIGDVDDGNTVTHWMEQERERGITITSAAVTCFWTQKKNKHGAVAVFCGVAGVQPQSETVWRQATKYKVPRIAFVNKMDRTGANFENALNDMRKKLGAYAYPVVIPIGREDYLKGVIDLVNDKAIVYDPADETGMKYDVTEIPEDLKDTAK